MEKTHKLLMALLAVSVVGIVVLLATSERQNGGGGFLGGENSFYPGKVTASTTGLNAASAKVILNANSARRYAVITNVSSSTFYMAMNATTSPNAVPMLENYNYAIPVLKDGGTYVINYDNLYLGQLIASTSAGGTEVRTIEAY